MEEINVEETINRIEEIYAEQDRIFARILELLEQL